MPQEETARLQRALTVEFITRRRLNAPAIWLRANADSPNAVDAIADTLDVDLGAWDGPEHNLGVRLVEGHLELSIRSGDDAFAHAFFLAADHLRLDARAAFGIDRVSSVILKIEEPELIEPWAPRWPKGFKDKHGYWTETKVVVSSPATKSARAVWRNSRPLPGSIVPEGVVVWRPKGKAAALDVDIDIGLEDLEPRALTPTSMDTLIRALAYATLVYWIRTYLDGLTDWDTILTRTLGGWIARVEVEGRGINAQGKSLEGICWCPIDTRESALDLVAFLGKLGASGDLKVAYLQGEAQLIRDPLAPVAGWNAIGGLFKQDGKQGIRRAFRAGLDLDVVERMSEQYIFDASTQDYLDRDRLLKGLPYEVAHEGLVRKHLPDGVYIGKKKLNPFSLYAASQLRTDVDAADMFPGAEPGAILHYSPTYGLLKPDQTQPDEYKVLNVYRGFTIKPIGLVDEAIMRKIVSALDYLLALLTKDNDAQMWWLKKFIAWTIQHPEIKQQVAPVIIGGQGIGKSVFGSNLMRAIFGWLAGAGNSSALEDNSFLITPFLNKLIVFVDEVRLASVDSINEIKRLVREIDISGEVKFGHRRDYRVYSRLLLAANKANIGLSPEDAADRALFFITAWDAQSKGMTDTEFLAWAVSLKPFFADFVGMLESVAIKQHLMRYFRDTECTRAELEDLTLSSRHDPNVVRSTMSRPRMVARAIVAEARVHVALDITAWFNPHQHLREAIRRIDGPKTHVEASSIMMEYERAGVIEMMSGGNYRFKWGYGRLLQKLGEAHNLELMPIFPTGPGDFDDNPVLSTGNPPPWRGNKTKQGDNRRRSFDPSDDDPDYMDPY